MKASAPRSSQKPYSMASGRTVQSGASSGRRAMPGLRPSGRSRTSLKRPCAVTQSARSGDDRISAPACRKVGRAARAVEIDPEGADAAEDAVLLQHRGVDGRIALVGREEAVRREDVDGRIPPGRVVGIDDDRARAGGSSGMPQEATRRAFMWRVK